MPASFRQNTKARDVFFDVMGEPVQHQSPRSTRRKKTDRKIQMQEETTFRMSL